MTQSKTANTISELATSQQMLSMSGLDFMTGILKGEFSGPPIAETLDFWLTDVQDGIVTFKGAPEFSAFNPLRTVHGGWYGTILDSCMACAVMTKVPKGSYYTTLEFKINIIRPVPVGRLVQATGTIQHAGRSTGVSNGQITDVENGRLYATGSTTCIIIKA